MSRVGKQPVSVPVDVTVKIDGDYVHIKGPKGELEYRIPSGIDVEQADGMLVVQIHPGGRGKNALWGTTRAVLSNMVQGVSEGFEKRLEIEGVGYRAQAQGNKLTLTLGFSHPVEFDAPQGITFAVEKNVITVSGIDKIKVGETAAKIRALKKPEPYKGKGIRYEGEIIRRKAGKKAAGAGE